MPEEITSVPLHKKKHLSPIYLYSSLGRISNSNPYSTYRSLNGDMTYSRNIRVHALYSGILGAFLELNNEHTNRNINKNNIHNH